MFDKTKPNDIAELKASLSHISKMHPEILEFLRDICYYDVPNTAIDTNQHLLISGAKNVYLVLKQVMREDLTSEQIAKIFKEQRK